MRFVIDIIMLAITTRIAIRSYLRISGYKSTSLADFAIMLLYLFQCIPVLLDLILGIPTYQTWFGGFKSALENESVAIIYDAYIMFLFMALYRVSKRYVRKKIIEEVKDDDSVITKMPKVPNLILWVMILLPFIIVILSGQVSSYLIYASSGTRGLDSSLTMLVSSFLIVSILCFYTWYFQGEANILRNILLLVFSLLFIWISGKRYSIVTVLYCFIYMYTIERRNYRKKINLRFGLILLGAFVIAFSAYYIMNIKITTDGSFQSTYAMLRIDFGRDDVVKFTILREYIENNHILDYPMQTVFSTIFMAVPRFIIPGKGYPHYRYLTAALYGSSIHNIPAGMTPSILEMMIANFRWMGIPICILFLCWYCKIADKARSPMRKLVFSVVLMGMLSQSLDAMIIPFYIAVYQILTSKVIFIFGRERK